MVNRTNTRQRWLDAGLTALEEEGAAGVRIDRIAARLGLSKGSFHHHFDGADGYKRELLSHFEALSTGALEQAIDGVGPPGDARAVLSALTAAIGAGRPDLYRPKLEVAVRAWATSDPEVQAVQSRIDAARLAALQRVWRPHTDDDAQARTAALLPYLVALGASVLEPPVSAEELNRVYELLLPLVPNS
ncbi:TetR/AcrR family transcriptional regulator [Mycolicibacterium sp. F2034L]|uniref:TetR/AcrR family transcriptional regulator n=1 Tax=Mycolicibacterium sp. F2034L TaxID=2926422 RepID=UPI001FF6B57C|nr:TetR/AcrR family transcriptional regulator [Mycolicibacterium sp. F2034L]MCK0173476.1 TetR/AcrR family transcriptional regulator [Mycolicibacterium sp. F2034L]